MNWLRLKSRVQEFFRSLTRGAVRLLGYALAFYGGWVLVSGIVLARHGMDKCQAESLAPMVPVLFQQFDEAAEKMSSVPAPRGASTPTEEGK